MWKEVECVWQFQSQRKSCNLDFAISNSLMQDISDANTSSKLKYERLVNKLSIPKTAPKHYSSLQNIIVFCFLQWNVRTIIKLKLKQASKEF